MKTQHKANHADQTLWKDSSAAPTQGASPLLKWPGGKRYLTKYLMNIMPPRFGTYIEPFAGGAALFFALRPRSAMLSDSNSELINCYNQVKSCPCEVISALSRLPNTRDDYYRVRSESPIDPIERAARLIYLVTLSFNGIYRENRQGVFNVPYGYKLHINPCDPTRIYQASEALALARIECADFATVANNAAAGDLIYLDPPYTVAHANNGFVKYNARIFSWSDQERLAKVAAQLHKRGCSVIVSNAAHDSIVNLYPGFTVVPVVRPSVIAAASQHRRSVTEYIIHNVS